MDSQNGQSPWSVEQRGVLCSGSIVLDILVRPVEEPRWGATSLVETIEYHVGGNGANTSLALATIGARVRLLGAVGCDEQASFTLERLRRAGVDAGAVARVTAPTATTVALVNRSGDRKFLHSLGASGVVFSEPIDFSAELTAGMAHYHLASLFLLPHMRLHAAETLRRARRAGLSTSLDTNWDPHGLWMQDLGPCLPQLDYLFMNEDEARMATGVSVPEAASEALLKGGVGTAVIKLGGRGCAIFSRAGETHCPAYQVDVQDTTGAGDCFVAGFLAAALHGADMAEAGRFANAVAALSVQRIGGVAGVPPFQEIQAWMRTAQLR